MQKVRPVQQLTAAALLIAVGIVIPTFSPLKIILEPASFTLASHVAIFLSMFISPAVAGAVAVGTTLGFFFGGFPPVVVLRAATHLVFALVGSILIQRYPRLLATPAKTQIFSLLLGVLHAACEVIVVSAFYFGGNMGDLYYAKGYVGSVMGLVGLGSIVHSMADFGIALLVLRALSAQKSLRSLFRSSPFPRVAEKSVSTLTAE